LRSRFYLTRRRMRKEYAQSSLDIR
jgi:hypothetical protein